MASCWKRILLVSTGSSILARACALKKAMLFLDGLTLRGINPRGRRFTLKTNFLLASLPEFHRFWITLLGLPSLAFALQQSYTLLSRFAGTRLTLKNPHAIGWQFPAGIAAKNQTNKNKICRLGLEKYPLYW